MARPSRSFRECRERIERDALPEEREGLLVATHFLAGMRYNDPGVFQLLGGNKAMIKVNSPLLRDSIDEATSRKASGEANGEANGRRPKRLSSLSWSLASGPRPKP